MRLTWTLLTIFCALGILGCADDAFQTITIERSPGSEKKEEKSEPAAEAAEEQSTAPSESAPKPPASRPDPVLPKPTTATSAQQDFDYYVDASMGTDTNDGRSFATPWQSLERVNQAKLQPGDRVAFKSGEVFKGRLHIQSSGSASEPIVFTAYESGAPPVLQAEGVFDETVWIENASHVVVENLEIANTGPEPQPGRKGIYILARDAGVVENITLRNLKVRDVNGGYAKVEDSGAGIKWLADSNQIATRFNGLLIENCHLIRCQRDGIKGGMDPWHDMTALSTQVVIRNNIIEAGGGDGIVPIGTKGAVVEFNRIYGGRIGLEGADPDFILEAGPSAGIWPWSAKNTVIRFNEVWDYEGVLDGQAFDADWNCDGTRFEFNLSGNNAGGFFLVCNFPVQEKIGRSIGNVNTLIRHNISLNDRNRGFVLNGPVRDVEITRNIIYNTTEDSFQLLVDTPWGEENYAVSATIRDNYFYLKGIGNIYKAIPSEETPGMWEPEDSINFQSTVLSNNFFTRVVGYRQNRYQESGMMQFTSKVRLSQLIGKLGEEPESREGFNTMLEFLKKSRNWDRIKVALGVSP